MGKITMLILMLALSKASAQVILSGSSDTPEKKFYFDNSARPVVPVGAEYDALTPYVLNVYFTLINDGNNENSASTALDTPLEVEAKFQECLEYLNVAFNPSNIFFKYKGYRIVQNSYIIANNWQFQVLPYSFPEGFVYPANDFAQYKKIDAMNLLFTDAFNSTEVSPLEFGILGYNATVLKIADLVSPRLRQTVVHKMGHNLGLLHTYAAEITPQHPPLPDIITNCEHVTREPLNPGFNANDQGDQIADTPAQPILDDSFFTNSCDGYFYDPTRVNCIGEPYVNLTNDNYMGFLYNIGTCDLRFTPGQTRRMREFILNDAETGFYENPYFNGSVAPTKNTVHSLFEPFERIKVFFPNPLTVTDNHNGTASVCRGYYEKFRFQRGFDYLFPDNESPDPLTADIHQTPFVARPPFNCPVTISQLGAPHTNLPSNTMPAETVDHAFLCTDEPFVSGSDTRTLIIGSMNLTVEELDAVRVKDPDLYNTLLAHYYHIIEKYTESGAKTTEVIYKP